MLAIKGIEMPTCCYSCRFAKFPYDGDKDPYCIMVFKKVDLSIFGHRPDWCPLVEIEEKKC